jgi:hypothetical protein
MGVLETHLTQLVLADVLDVASGSVQPQPARPVDIAHPQRPLAIENVRVTVGHRHHLFVQAHAAAPVSSSWLPQAKTEGPDESCQRGAPNTNLDGTVPDAKSAN